MRYAVLVLTLLLEVCSPALASPEWTEANEIVYQTIAMESANQDLIGQALVARVIINRSVVSHKSLEEICKAPKQFSCWNNEKQAKIWLRTHFDENTRRRAIEAYRLAVGLKKRVFDGLTHYHATSVRPYWAKGKTPAYKVGSHWFYEGIK